MPPKSHSVIHIRRAVNVLRRGGIIAYPTEGVWGLGCDPFDRQAVEGVLALKARPVHKGLILVGASISQFSGLVAHLSDAQRQRLLASSDHPITWLVPNRGFAPAWITGQHSSVAIRISQHPVVIALCEKFGAPLVSTSANPQGRKSATSELQVRRYFQGKLNYIVPGQTEAARSGRASEIRDLVTGVTIRAGS